MVSFHVTLSNCPFVLLTACQSVVSYVINGNEMGVALLWASNYIPTV